MSFAVIINDEPSQRVLIQTLLEHEGFRVKDYANPVSALLDLAASADVPDIIITDLHMPEIDGWKLCRVLRGESYKAYNNTPILVVSATYTGSDPKKLSLENGANEFLTSPFKPQVFLETVNRIIKGKTMKRKESVLILEDSVSLAKLLKQEFQNQGYDAQYAISGSKGREEFEKLAPNVIIVDYHLPDIQGDVLLREFRKASSDAVIVMVTTDPEPNLAVSWLKKGANAYVRKPFEPSYLIDLCKRAEREQSLLTVESVLVKRAKEQEDKDKIFKSIFEYSPLGIEVFNAKGHLVMANPALFKMFGMVNPKESKNFNLFKDPIISNEVKERIKEGQSLHYEKEFDFAQIKSFGYFTTEKLGKSSVDVHISPIWNENKSSVSHYIILLKDISREKHVEEQLRKRLLYEETIAVFSHDLLINPSADWKELLAPVLRISGANRLYVFENFDSPEDGLCTRQVYELCKPGTASEANNPMLKGLRYAPDLERWKSELAAGRIITGAVKGFPDGEKNLLVQQHIKSVLVIPIFRGDEWYGFIGFDDTETDQPWSREDINLLTTASEMLGRNLYALNNLKRLKTSVQDKEILLNEIHNRVKKNFSLITSLISLQSDFMETEKDRGILTELKDKIQSILLIHQKLYQSKTFGSINIRDYLEEAVDSLTTLSENQPLIVQKEIEDIDLSLDSAIPLVLIITELVINAAKYAFPKKSMEPGFRGIIRISLRRENSSCLLTVTDNGVGMADDIDPEDSSSLGLNLVAALTDQLNGVLTITKAQGASFEIRFPYRLGELSRGTAVESRDF